MALISIIIFSFIGAILLFLAFMAGIFFQNRVFSRYIRKKDAASLLEIDRNLGDMARTLTDMANRPIATAIVDKGITGTPVNAPAPNPPTSPTNNEPGTFEMNPDPRTREEKQEQAALGRLLESEENKFNPEA